MACFRPLVAYRGEDRRITFSEARDFYGKVVLPCGRCIGCRLVRQRAWAIRCVHESQMHRESCFVTLTYDDKFYSPSLDYSDFQYFMRKLRRACGPTRFFACGEYGELGDRPHFHALLFGRSFPRDYGVTKDTYGSRLLDGIWGKGFVSVGDVSLQSAAYVAGYCVKKITGPMADGYYRRLNVATGELVDVVPEFGRMSLKPGIGYSWFQKYWREVYGVRDGVVQKGGFVLPPPRYYDKLLLERDPGLSDEKSFDRYVRSQRFLEDCSPERLLVRETCAKARFQLKRRKL